MISKEKATRLAEEQELAMNEALLIEKNKPIKTKGSSADILVKASRKRKALSL